MTPGPDGRAPLIEELSAHDLARARIRQEHLLEVETGFRSGSRFWARPGEPRPAFDPSTISVGERRRAKVAELGALAEAEAIQLGLEAVSERTLNLRFNPTDSNTSDRHFQARSTRLRQKQIGRKSPVGTAGGRVRTARLNNKLKRMAARYRQLGLVGLADGRWSRQGGGHPSVTAEVEEAIRAVHEQCLRRSRISMASRERLIYQYVREVFPDREVRVPHRTTLARVWAEWFGPGGARQRYVRSAAAVPAPAGAPVVASRPGQLVVLDSTPLPVKVLDDVFGTAITVHLTIALDAYTHSIVAFRLTPVAEKSIEVAMLLRDVLSPLPMRPGWGESMVWPYPGVPAALVADLAGGPVAGLPFFRPEAITVDHGAAFKNHHLIEVARTLGIDVLPARAMRPTDKAACERAFAAIQSLLLELVPGWRGIDVADRGADPEADAAWTVAEMEHLLASWIVSVFTDRELCCP
ncbi:hypothetical protein [Streptomyces sp. NPDC053726]|uniref:hypothetical protein n=1 Tax=Streptomyces sp. NPDC053726 TaxID=3365713 RepID=UPI0037D3AEFE